MLHRVSDGRSGTARCGGHSPHLLIYVLRCTLCTPLLRPTAARRRNCSSLCFDSSLQQHKTFQLVNTSILSILLGAQPFFSVGDTNLVHLLQQAAYKKVVDGHRRLFTIH